MVSAKSGHENFRLLYKDFLSTLLEWHYLIESNRNDCFYEN